MLPQDKDDRLAIQQLLDRSLNVLQEIDTLKQDLDAIADEATENGMKKANFKKLLAVLADAPKAEAKMREIEDALAELNILENIDSED